MKEVHYTREQALLLVKIRRGRVLKSAAKHATLAAAAAAETVECSASIVRAAYNKAAERCAGKKKPQLQSKTVLPDPILKEAGFFEVAQKVMRSESLRLALETSKISLKVLALMPTHQIRTLVKDELADHFARNIFSSLHGHRCFAVPSESPYAARSPRARSDSDSGSPTGRKSSRLKYRQILGDLIGPAPQDRTWQDEYGEAVAEGSRILGHDLCEYPHRQNTVVLQAYSDKKGFTQQRIEAGFDYDEAAIIMAALSSAVSLAIGRGIVDKSPRYAAMTHTFFNILANKAKTDAVVSDTSCVLRTHYKT
jgi:hypothetical protein